MVNLLVFKKKIQLQDISRWPSVMEQMVVTPTYVLLVVVEPQELLGKSIHFFSTSIY